MSVFNFIETFFFISLGITFVLISLLIYHFRERIIILEQKNDTMFEIMNNVVKEMTNIRHTVSIIGSGQNYPHMSYTPFPDYVDGYEHQGNLTDILEDKTDVESAEDEDDEEDDEEEDDEDEEEDDDADDEDEDDDEEDDADDEDEEEEEDEYQNIQKIIVSDDDVNYETVKIVNVNIDSSVVDINDLIVDDNSDAVSIDSLPELLHVDEPLHVQKLETSNLDELPVKSVHENNAEVYGKMTTQELKTLVITKGLTTNPSKLKKNQLLKLLEENP